MYHGLFLLFAHTSFKVRHAIFYINFYYQLRYKGQNVQWDAID